MIALLAAATLAAAQPAPAPRLFVYSNGPVGRLEVRAPDPAVCAKDPRLQQADAERAILRDSDRRLVARRLMELPVAYACPVGGLKESGK